MDVAMKKGAPGCNGCDCRAKWPLGFYVAQQGGQRAIVELMSSGGEYLVRPWGASECDDHQSLTAEGDDGCGWTLIDWIDVDGRTGAYSAVIAERDRLIEAVRATSIGSKPWSIAELEGRIAELHTNSSDEIRQQRDAIAGQRDSARAERDRLRGRLAEVEREAEARTERAIEAGQDGIRYWKAAAIAERDAAWKILEENEPPDPADDGIPF